MTAKSLAKQKAQLEDSAATVCLNRRCRLSKVRVITKLMSIFTGISSLCVHSEWAEAVFGKWQVLGCCRGSYRSWEEVLHFLIRSKNEKMKKELKHWNKIKKITKCINPQINQEYAAKKFKQERKIRVDTWVRSGDKSWYTVVGASTNSGKWEGYF